MTRDAAEASFSPHRDELVRVAYRILGSWAEAEDVVQDAWLRWSTVDVAAVDRPIAYLVRVVTRLAIDAATRASVRRETYVGPWLPEPASFEPGPDERAIETESLTLGFVAVLQRLGPVDRAVFVLHDVFGWSFAEIGDVVDREEATCRQIGRRARQRVRDERRGIRCGSDGDLELLGSAIDAAQAGEVDRLVALLRDDVVFLSDGGPNRHAARQPVVGPDRVARFITGLARRAAEGDRWTIELGWVNGQLASLLVEDGQIIGAVVGETDGDRIVAFHSVLAPEKIDRLERM